MYQDLPDKKRYVEFISAILTVPVLLTVVVSNILNIQKQNQHEAKADFPTPTIEQNRPLTVSLVVPTSQTTPVPSPTENPPAASPTSAECKKEVGPIEITSPKENETVSGDPVNLDITRSDSGDYCAVVWSYRINSGSWSDYNDKSISIYNLSAGKKTVDLRVKSIASGNETVLTRNFNVAGTPSPTPTFAPSATPTP